MNSKLRVTISISTALALIIIFHYIGWFIPVENFLRKIINKGAEPIYQASINGDKNNEQNNIDELLLQIEILNEENIQLRNQLTFFNSSTYTNVGAEVIGRNVDPVANTLILNKGQNHGIEVGNPVVALNGIFIGKITRAEKDISIVRLLPDGQSKIAATIRNIEKTIGIIEGGYGLSIQMNLIPQNETVNIGDKIMTSGLEQGIPRGLYIGKVEEVQKEAYEPFQEAIITPAVDTRKIHTVSIIINELSS